MDQWPLSFLVGPHLESLHHLYMAPVNRPKGNQAKDGQLSLLFLKETKNEKRILIYPLIIF